MQYTGERLIVNDLALDLDKESDIYREHYERYRFAVDKIKQFNKNKTPVKILDIACGSGYGSKLIADLESVEIWGGDINREVIELAQNKYQTTKNLLFKIMEADNLLFEDNFFDIVVSFETIEHIGNYKGFVNEIKRVLKPGGKLILSTPNRLATKKLAIKNPYHIKEFSQDELVKLFDSFSTFKLYGQRPLLKMSWQHKFLQKLYLFYRSCSCLRWLAKLTPGKFKQNTADKINGVEDSFDIKEIKEGREYLYYVLVGKK